MREKYTKRFIRGFLVSAIMVSLTMNLGMPVYASTPVPTVISVSPNSGLTTGGTVITIKGTNLTYPTGGIKIGGVYATNVHVDSDSQITATTPNMPLTYKGGIVDVIVITAGGPSATSTNDQFTYYVPTSTVTSVSPNSGPTTGGTVVTIKGTHLTYPTGVKIGGYYVTNVNANKFEPDNDNQITATIPAVSSSYSGTLTMDITVTTVGGTSAKSINDQFTYISGPIHTLTYIPGVNGNIKGALSQPINIGYSGSTVTAVPNSGYHFVNWSDGVTTQSRTDTNVSADISVTANFASDLPTTYALTYTAGANGTITGILNQTVNSGDSGSTVTAVPNSGYHFVDWSDGVTTQSRTDTNVSADTSVTANFALNSSSQNDPTPIETVTTPASVIIEGTERVGNTLESQLLSKNGTNFTTSSAVTYEWYRLSSKYSETGSLIGNNKTYKLVSSDQNNYIKVLAICNGKTFEDITGKILKQSSSSSSSSSSSHHNSLKSNNSSNNGSTIVTNGWETMDDNTRRYIKNGQVVTGWIKSDNEWYYLRENGVMASGWEQIGDNWYLFNINGTMITGWANIDDKWYFLKSNGAMATYWEQVGFNIPVIVPLAPAV